MQKQRLTLDNAIFQNASLQSPSEPTRKIRRDLTYRNEFVIRAGSTRATKLSQQQNASQHEVGSNGQMSTVSAVASRSLGETPRSGAPRSIDGVLPSQSIASNTASKVFRAHHREVNAADGTIAAAVQVRSSQGLPDAPQKSEKSSRRRGRLAPRVRLSQPQLLYGMASVLFVLGVFVAVSGFQVNNHVAAQVETLQKSASSQGASANGTPPPSEKKPSAYDISNYTVAPDMPRYISIPKLGVHSRVLPMGVNENNQLEAPKNIFDAGWYDDSSKPGLPGAMLVDGHSGIGKTNGIFHDAAKLKKGDTMTVERGDGTKFVYRVTSVSVLKVDSVDMSSMVTPDENADEGLNIITCTGKQIPGTTSLDQRVLVKAVRN